MSTPAERWDAIASECGPDERLEIEQRLYALRLELDAVEDWDGDTRDDIHKAIEQFRRLLQLALLRVGGRHGRIPLKRWRGHWRATLCRLQGAGWRGCLNASG